MVLAGGAKHVTLVTGANKGIGRALVETILKKQPEAHVLLGSRDLERGQKTVGEIVEANPAFKDRLELLHLDVSSSASVDAAVKTVTSKYGDVGLYGLVNNAGIGLNTTPKGTFNVLQTNFFGSIIYTTEAFAPLLKDYAAKNKESGGARIVNLGSGAGPTFVRDVVSDQRRSWYMRQRGIDKKEMLDVYEKALQCLKDFEADDDETKQKGETAWTQLGMTAEGGGKQTPWNAYKCSKAFVALGSAYHADLYKDHGVSVMCCSPGFIITDMTAGFGASRTAEDGAYTPYTLLYEIGNASDPFKDDTAKLPRTNGILTGLFFGSDQKRSPLHLGREPGDPVYDGSIPEELKAPGVGDS